MTRRTNRCTSRVRNEPLAQAVITEKVINHLYLFLREVEDRLELALVRSIRHSTPCNLFHCTELIFGWLSSFGGLNFKNFKKDFPSPADPYSLFSSPLLNFGLMFSIMAQIEGNVDGIGMLKSVEQSFLLDQLGESIHLETGEDQEFKIITSKPRKSKK